MYPPIEPFATGFLPVSDGNEIYWETSGNPAGQPALHLHGGPGSGILTGHRRRFDPAHWLIVAFEQRGCGRSRPLVTDPAAPPLSTNQTGALIADIETLRLHLGVDRWLVTGLSWGATLALAYAQTHPERVTALVLAAVTSTSEAEVQWITEDVGRVFPREWEAFAAASSRKPGQRIVDAYVELLADPDPAVRERAALAWCIWEDTHVSFDPAYTHDTRYDDPGFRLLFATLVTHYWKHAGFGPPGGLLAHMDRLTGIPGVLIHGRLDVSGPLATAWELHGAWPNDNSELIVVDSEGHGGDLMIDHLIAAIARFAR